MFGESRLISFQFCLWKEIIKLSKVQAIKGYTAKIIEENYQGGLD